MKPTIGRIVHVTINSRELAAIVTEVFADDTINACVFTPFGPEQRLHLFEGVAGCENCWHWPPRDAS